MTYDFTPLFRTAIGFDRLARLMDSAVETASSTSYPPYNIEKLEDDRYRLTMAVAGFGAEDLDLVARDNTLVVSGKPRGAADNAAKGEVVYRGISGRPFERRFVLADHIVVEGADLHNGLLHVELRRVVPEALKPRRIAIGNAPQVASIANGDAASNDQAGEAKHAA